MFSSPTPAGLIPAAPVAPSLVPSGNTPRAANLLRLSFGMMSMIAPPVALAAFAAATITEDVPLKTGGAEMRVGGAPPSFPSCSWPRRTC